MPFTTSPTLQDLITAISDDWSINSMEKLRLLAEIKRQTNQAPGWTLLSSLMYGGFGAVFGNLIAKYFGLGIIGRSVATAVGAGIGSSLYDRKFNDSGWKSI